ncbi:MAG: hypothetical protein AAFY77_06825 [Pseudomonadota bacterium]
MSSLSRLGAMLAILNTNNRYEALFSMSDRDLAARGLRREELTRHYVTGIGAL